MLPYFTVHLGWHVCIVSPSDSRNGKHMADNAEHISGVPLQLRFRCLGTLAAGTLLSVLLLSLCPFFDIETSTYFSCSLCSAEVMRSPCPLDYRISTSAKLLTD